MATTTDELIELKDAACDAAGHADAVITARVYTHVMALGDGERDALRALVDGAEWAPVGTNGSRTASAGTQPEPAFGSTMRVRGVAQPG